MLSTAVSRLFSPPASLPTRLCATSIAPPATAAASSSALVRWFSTTPAQSSSNSPTADDDDEDSETPLESSRPLTTQGFHAGQFPIGQAPEGSEGSDSENWLSSAHSDPLQFPPKGAKVFDLDSGEGLNRKIAVFNARHQDGINRTPVCCLYSGDTGRTMMTLRKEELQAVVELVPKLKATFRKFSKI